jgi:uridine kinase
MVHLNNDAEPDRIEIRVKNAGSVLVDRGSTLEELYRRLQDKVPYPIMAGVVNNTLVDLYYTFESSCEVELLDLSSEIGLQIYRRTAVFVLLKACRELFPERRLIVEHSLSNGLYCQFSDCTCTAEEADLITEKMNEIVRADLPIHKLMLPTTEACNIFAGQGQDDKVRLLRFRNKAEVHVYEMDRFYEYFYGYMLPHTGYIQMFRLLSYAAGLILQTPEKEEPGILRPYIPQPKLANVFREAREWAVMLQASHLADLNDIVARGDAADLIRVNEALHEKKIAYIADSICKNPQTRLVLISGPSSSGKTTFAQRLLVQLRVNGRRPVSISLDNYFVDRCMTPIDENGEYDFESIDALKLELFNNHLSQLIAGETVEIPIYNFKRGCCDEKGLSLKVPDGEPIIIEGIHGLNDRLTEAIPREQKYKIYVSALTQLNIDSTNRIPTTDGRLIRRMVRDNRTRGHSAIETIRRWPSVRRGEERNIFPYQENADVIFNSSLVYELSVLKNYAEELLNEIGEQYSEHLEAKRLLKFLSYFRPIDGSDIPPNSILREFIGGSWFKD